jgi:tetratricopeptide (TPR) repeat protein
MPIPVLVADGLAALKKWDALLASLAAPANATAKPWGADDYLRLAFRTRAFKELGNAASAKTEWAAAIKATDLGDKRFEHLVRLLEVAGQWKWGFDPATRKVEPEYEDALWAAIDNFPSERRGDEGLNAVYTRVISQLESILYQTRRSQLLLKLYAQLHKASPENIAVKNNLASVALVLNAQDYKPHQLAQEVYDFDKGNPFYSATYAYSLVMQKKYPQAMEVMGKIKPEFLSQPSLSGCYGLVLAGLGKTAEARKYLGVAMEAKDKLLPEELEIYRQAASGK